MGGQGVAIATQGLARQAAFTSYAACLAAFSLQVYLSLVGNHDL